MKHLLFNTTPVNKLNYFSNKLGVNLYVKRDDLFLEAGGGSKARMLQYILSDIKSENYDVLLTAGGPCSNFNRACALMCAKIGIPMHLVEYTDDPNEYKSSLNYYICQLAGIKTTRCKKSEVPETISKVLNQYQSKGEKVKFIYGGGKSIEGIYSYYEAVKELYTQIQDIDHIFIACGTGTTLSGICAGVQKYYPNTKIHAISTARNYDAELPVLTDNIKLLNKYLGTKYSLDNLKFYDEYICGGYAKYNNSIMNIIKECISNEGMIIDPTYSGKAFWGMNNIIESSETFKDKNILFWNTGGIMNLLSAH